HGGADHARPAAREIRGRPAYAGGSEGGNHRLYRLLRHLHGRREGAHRHAPSQSEPQSRRHRHRRAPLRIRHPRPDHPAPGGEPKPAHLGARQVAALSRMHRSLVLLLALAAPALYSQAWPAKPIHIVVPSPPGGPPDLIIRLLAPKLSFGPPLVFENRAGAGGIVGRAYVAKTAPDGHTGLFTTPSHVNTPPFNDDVALNPVRG